MAPKILVVDDDPAINEMLTIVLEAEGFQTSSVTDGVEAVPAFRSFDPDLILLDLMLPGMNGIDICREIRKESAVPVVMLTAKTDTVDVVLGLESGADDYITKPFKPKELVARIRARLRRTDETPADVFEVGDLTVDVPQHTVTRGDEEIQLTPLETSWWRWRASPTRCTRARNCWSPCGATATPPTPAWSTCTCSVCAPRSSTTRRTRRLSSPCAVWATKPVSRRCSTWTPYVVLATECGTPGPRSCRSASWARCCWCPRS